MKGEKKGKTPGVRKLRLSRDLVTPLLCFPIYELADLSMCSKSECTKMLLCQISLETTAQGRRSLGKHKS
jgi:hypothetical protein